MKYQDKIAATIAAIVVGFVFIKNCKRTYTRLTYGVECGMKVTAEDMEINGIIKRKYIDSSNHALWTITVKENKETDSYYFPDGQYQELWTKMQVGDSILKTKKSLRYLLWHKNRKDTVLVKYNCTIN